MPYVVSSADAGSNWSTQNAPSVSVNLQSIFVQTRLFASQLETQEISAGIDDHGDD